MPFRIPPLVARRAMVPLTGVVVLFGLVACSDDDEPSLTEAAQEGDAGDVGEAAPDGSDGLPALFELSACDMVPAEDLQAAGLTPEPDPTHNLGDDDDGAGNPAGNDCVWSGTGRFARVAFTLSDLESHYFAEVVTDDETEVDGLPARRFTGFDDDLGTGTDPTPACLTRIEVEPGVILAVEVAVSTTIDDYSTDDDARMAQACETLDQLLPVVSANALGGSTESSGGADAGASSTTEPSTEPSSGGSGMTVEAAVARFEEYVHAVGTSDVETVCEIAASAFEAAGYSPDEYCNEELIGEMRAEYTADELESLSQATVDPNQVAQIAPDRVEIPPTAIQYPTPVDDSGDQNGVVMAFDSTNWFIVEFFA